MVASKMIYGETVVFKLAVKMGGIAVFVRSA